MTKRRLRKLSFDDEHYRLALAYRNARGGDKTRTLKALQGYVAKELGITSLSPRVSPSDEQQREAER